MLNDPRYVREIKISQNESLDYPYNLPIVKNIQPLKLHNNVTYFVGENGSGKSTILEALAVSLRFNPEGGTRNTVFNV